MVIGENVPPRFLSLCFRSVSVFCSFMVKYFIIHHFIFFKESICYIAYSIQLVCVLMESVSKLGLFSGSVS